MSKETESSYVLIEKIVKDHGVSTIEIMNIAINGLISLYYFDPKLNDHHKQMPENLKKYLYSEQLN